MKKTIKIIKQKNITECNVVVARERNENRQEHLVREDKNRGI